MEKKLKIPTVHNILESEAGSCTETVRYEMNVQIPPRRVDGRRQVTPTVLANQIARLILTITDLTNRNTSQVKSKLGDFNIFINIK